MLTTSYPGTDTFVVYYVNGCSDDRNLFARYYPTGIVICMVNRLNPPDSSLNLINTLAHELGHAQSLQDVAPPRDPPINLMDLARAGLLADITIAQVNSLTGTSTQ